MKPYVLSAAAGILVGIIYGLLKMRSPAPPVIALAGLLGILAGEQLVLAARHLIETRRVDLTKVAADCGKHMFGRLPGADS